MKLSDYLREKGFSHAAFGKTIGVSQPIMSGWVNGGSVPEKRAVQIERATEGAVTRIDLRPDDWHEIWPELATSEEKQPLPSAGRSSAATEAIATHHPAPPQPAPAEAAATSQGVANV
jgi:DNA-binding transcriptional regulator YdaS (Cro superfamily)